MKLGGLEKRFAVIAPVSACNENLSLQPPNVLPKIALPSAFRGWTKIPFVDDFSRGVLADVPVICDP